MGIRLFSMVKSPVAHLLLISLGFIAFVGTLLPGACGQSQSIKDKFKEADKNGDEHLCYKEYHASNPNVSEAKFDEAAGRDKRLDLEEYMKLEGTGSAPPPGFLMMINDFIVVFSRCTDCTCTSTFLHFNPQF